MGILMVVLSNEVSLAEDVCVQRLKVFLHSPQPSFSTAIWLSIDSRFIFQAFSCASGAKIDERDPSARECSDPLSQFQAAFYLYVRGFTNICRGLNISPTTE